MKVRGIRGAITVEQDTEQDIMQATRELLTMMVDKNQVATDDIAAVIFTVTPDLSQAFPARAARDMGWQYVPLMCATEIGVPGGLPRCIRVLMLVNTDRSPREVSNVYLREAVRLRDDLF